LKPLLLLEDTLSRQNSKFKIQNSKFKKKKKKKKNKKKKKKKKKLISPVTHHPLDVRYYSVVDEP